MPVAAVIAGGRPTVSAGTAELKATLVYRDWPGTTSSSLHRINDMDLRVTAPGGTVYWGNNGLLAGNWSTPGGTSNTVDTVENVFVENPAGFQQPRPPYRLGTQSGAPPAVKAAPSACSTR